MSPLMDLCATHAHSDDEQLSVLEVQECTKGLTDVMRSIWFEKEHVYPGEPRVFYCSNQQGPEELTEDP